MGLGIRANWHCVKLGRSAYQLSPNLSTFHLFGIIGGGVGVVVVGNMITEAVVLPTDRQIYQQLELVTASLACDIVINVSSMH